ncbi:hypothetical protein NSTC731_04322 [Nostoc sp. DSM 114167]|jgi:hypothetical protein
MPLPILARQSILENAGNADNLTIYIVCELLLDHISFKFSKLTSRGFLFLKDEN